MKILIYGDHLFAQDMAWGFLTLDHDVRWVNPQTIPELDALIQNENPDLLMTLGSPAFFGGQLLEHLGRRRPSSMKCIHWDTDGITWADIEMRHIYLMKPDIVFTVCPDMLQLLRAQHIPSEMLFYAFCPDFHHPGPIAAENEGQIAFVAGAYPEIVGRVPKHYRRISMDVLIKPLLDRGCQIDFYGDDRHKDVMKFLYDVDIPHAWLHGHYPYEQTWKIYNSCNINLVTQNHEDTLTKRTFEILGSGGFALSYDNAAVRKYFHPGRDIVVSSSPEETIALVEFYRTHPEEYKSIRENALISVQNHTYKQRAEQILHRVTQKAVVFRAAPR